jgi:hypothetical protein
MGLPSYAMLRDFASLLSARSPKCGGLHYTDIMSSITSPVLFDDVSGGGRKALAITFLVYRNGDVFHLEATLQRPGSAAIERRIASQDSIASRVSA